MHTSLRKTCVLRRDVEMLVFYKNFGTAGNALTIKDAPNTALF